MMNAMGMMRRPAMMVAQERVAARNPGLAANPARMQQRVAEVAGRIQTRRKARKSMLPARSNAFSMMQ